MKKTGLTSGASSAKTIKHPATKAYQQNGMPATAETRGIVIENEKKVVRE